jgi:hypothetical protein
MAGGSLLPDMCRGWKNRRTKELTSRRWAKDILQGDKLACRKIAAREEAFGEDSALFRFEKTKCRMSIL